TLHKAALAISHNIGEKFFESLTEHLCDSLGVDFALVGMLRIEEDALESVAVHGHGKAQSPLRYGLGGTPV
ncbi:MAG: hypothetical protein ACI9W2_002183, partial [Gammaproteobacteria bacterium]